MNSGLPASLAQNPRLSRWVGFEAGRVIVRSGKVELGQGIRTALAQIAADELGVPIELIDFPGADTRLAPDEGLTAGSLSVQVSGASMRQACAQARELARRAAAERLGSPPDELELELDDGVFRCTIGEVDYWSLPMADLLDADATADMVPLSPARRRHVGQSVPRTDLRAKLVGEPVFITDLRPAGLLFARIIRPGARKASLINIDLAAIADLGATVIRDRDFLAVVSPDEATVVEVAKLVAAAAEWDLQESLPDQANLGAFLESVGNDVVQFAGNAELAPTMHSATYSRPYLAHAAMGPVTAMAQWDGASLAVWSHSQGIHPLRDALAIALGLDTSGIEVTHVDGPGSYGHNGADDVAFDAAFLAMRLPGPPIMVQWSRADELRWSPLGPAMRARLAADLDGSGHITAWRHDVWSNGHSSRPNKERPGFFSWTAAGGPPVPLSADPPFQSGGGSGRNSVPGYDFPAISVVGHRATQMPLRTSSLRALGAYLNVFAIESFMDELADQVAADPLEFRLAHLSDPRGRAVLSLAAERAGWPHATGSDCALGIGYAKYKGTSAYCAVVAEVEAVTEIRVRRLTIAVDVGLVINPDGVANQIEGGAIQATSWTLREAVKFDRFGVTSDSWESYPILRFSEVPDVEVHLIAESEAPSVGAGEAAAGPTAAAIGNAVARALGVRVRDLPITAEAVIAAIQA